MQTHCYKRLRKAIQSIQSQSDEYIHLAVNADKITEWTAMVKGPPDSVYDGFIFELAIHCEDNYPLVPPKMSFKTKIFHPNIYFDTGEICLDILKKEWSPAWSLQSACRAIMTLMGEPAPER